MSSQSLLLMLLLCGVVEWSSRAALADSPREPAVAGGELTVIVLGLQSDAGTVLTALFDSEEDFDALADPVRRGKLVIEERAARVSWTGLPAGEYALRLVHDENGNGEVDTNWVGIPTEPFGFSKDPVSRFGPPGFEGAKFTLGSEALTLRVRLQEF